MASAEAGQRREACRQQPAPGELTSYGRPCIRHPSGSHIHGRWMALIVPRGWPLAQWQAWRRVTICHPVMDLRQSSSSVRPHGIIARGRAEAGLGPIPASRFTVVYCTSVYVTVVLGRSGGSGGSGSDTSIGYHHGKSLNSHTDGTQPSLLRRIASKYIVPPIAGASGRLVRVPYVTTPITIRTSTGHSFQLPPFFPL